MWHIVDWIWTLMTMNSWRHHGSAVAPTPTRCSSSVASRATIRSCYRTSDFSRTSGSPDVSPTSSLMDSTFFSFTILTSSVPVPPNAWTDFQRNWPGSELSHGNTMKIKETTLKLTIKLWYYGFLNEFPPRVRVKGLTWVSHCGILIQIHCAENKLFC